MPTKTAQHSRPCPSHAQDSVLSPRKGCEPFSPGIYAPVRALSRPLCSAPSASPCLVSAPTHTSLPPPCVTTVADTEPLPGLPPLTLCCVRTERADHALAGADIALRCVGKPRSCGHGGSRVRAGGSVVSLSGCETARVVIEVLHCIISNASNVLSSAGSSRTMCAPR